MKAGATVEWEFTDVGRTLPVDVKEIEQDRRIVFEWTASGVRARVTILLEPADAETTRISIKRSRMAYGSRRHPASLGTNAGWTDFVCCMKAYLQHGINLVARWLRNR
jgi:uncharacterized protein YndB with AHSA1/START domain